MFKQIMPVSPHRPERVEQRVQRSATWFIEQPGQPALDVARAPLADGVIVDSELTRHRAVGDAVGAAEQDAGTLGEGVAGLGQLGPTDEFCAILGGDIDRFTSVSAARAPAQRSVTGGGQVSYSSTHSEGFRGRSSATGKWPGQLPRADEGSR